MLRNNIVSMATILIAAGCSAAISSEPHANEESLRTPITFTERPNIRFEGQATLFAIDDESLPWTRGIELGMVQPKKHPNNPVLARGEEGKFSFSRVARPTVILKDGKWRMWYTVTDHENARMAAYAESDDGIHWIKPNLGLVEFNGNMNNNFVDAQPGLAGAAVVMDPAARPERRYVMTGEKAAPYMAQMFRLEKEKGPILSVLTALETPHMRKKSSYDWTAQGERRRKPCAMAEAEEAARPLGPGAQQN